MNRFGLIMVGVVVVFAAHVYPAPITMHYSATVTNKDGTTSGTLDEIEPDDIIEGYFTYDPAETTDVNSGDVTGYYPFTPESSGADLIISSPDSPEEPLFDLEGYLLNILVQNDWTYGSYPVIDAFSPHALLSNGWEMHLYYQNRNTHLDVITSDELPAPPPAYDQYSYTRGTLISSSSRGQVYFRIDSLTLIMIICEGDLDQDEDVDGVDLEALSKASDASDVAAFTESYGRVNGCTDLHE